jgi:TonB family protein
MKGENKMFDQLTESSTDQNDARGRRGYFIITAILVGALFVGGVVWSLYGKELVLGSGDMELSALIAPVSMPESAPRPPQPKAERHEVAETNVKVATRQTNMLRITDNPIVPKGVSVTPNTTKARTSNFRISPGIETGGNTSSLSVETGRSTNTSESSGSGEQIAAVEPPMTTTPPLPIKKIDPPVETKRDVRISLGVVTGKATDLPVPVYSAPAKAVGAEGVVSVRILIDEAGNVTSAKALSGHALLRQSAEKAARGAKFKPTLLSNEPVKAMGVIAYNFHRN